MEGALLSAPSQYSAASSARRADAEPGAAAAGGEVCLRVFIAPLRCVGYLLHSEQLHLEHQGRVRGNDRRITIGAVGQRRRHPELALAADLHAHHALVPTLDHAALADREGERLAAVARAVELVAVGEPARVVHRAGL